MKKKYVKITRNFETFFGPKSGQLYDILEKVLALSSVVHDRRLFAIKKR